MAYDALQAVEPIWSVAFRPQSKVRLTLSVMEITICSPSEGKMIAMDRPLAMDMCGGLIFVLSKYGLIKVFDAYTRAVCHEFPPPETGAKTPLLQHCYQGMRVSGDTMWSLYPGGLVRCIKLGAGEK